MRIRFAIVLVLVCLVTGMAEAGVYYETSDKTYYKYEDENPNYETMVPAKGESYASNNYFGERRLDITLSTNGPVLRIATIPKVNGGYAGMKQAIIAEWKPLFTDLKVTNEAEYTNDRGVKFRFFEATGKTTAGGTGMIRFAAFTKGSDMVYVELFCASSAYTGTVKNHWMKAIHSFKWL